MKLLQPDELEDELFLAMLTHSRRGAGPEFDLPTLCEALGIGASKQQLLAFTSDNDGIFGSKNVTHQTIRFTLNADGRRHAKGLEEARRKPTIRERIKSVPIGKGVWEVLKLSFAAIAGALAQSYFGS